MNAVNEELRLQRLIDGALNVDERRSYLAELDKHPHRWRDVALAFVEEQIWREQINASLRPAASSAVPHEQKKHAVDRAPLTRLPNWLALAACLFVGMSIGVLSRPHPVNPTHEVATDQDHIDRAVIEKPLRRGAHESEATVVHSNDAPIGQIRLVSTKSPTEELLTIPVYDQAPEAMIDPFLDQFSDWQLANQDLMSVGYQLGWDADYLQAELDDGKTIVVPVRTISMQPFGQ